MLAYTYVERGKFALLEKPKPVLLDERDAIVKVTLASICTSDLHIKHGSVPRAVPGITVGHEMVGVVEAVGPAVRSVRPGDRVTVAITRGTGAVAVLLAYVVPFVVLIGVVAVCYLLGAGDGAAVLAGLGSVVLYYGILWLLRRKIDNAIHFTISE